MDSDSIIPASPIGAKVELCAGPISKNADYVIYDLEQQLNPAEVFFKLMKN